jgi:hypothetical protein
MARRKAEYKTYLFQRSHGGPWWIKLRSGGQRVERSLGATDKAVAELAAMPLLADHKTRPLAARAPDSHLRSVFAFSLKPRPIWPR